MAPHPFRLRGHTALRFLPTYLGGAWIALQAGAILLPNFGIPGWVFRTLVSLLALGLVGLLFAGFALPRITRRRRGFEDLGIDDALAGEGEPPTAAAAEGSAAGRRRWRRKRAPAFAGFGLLALAAVWQFGFGGELPGLIRARAAELVPPEDRVLVAEFEDRSSRAPALGPAVREALVADVSQSERVRIVERDEIVAGLRAMRRPDTTALTTALSLELARREAYPAVITGTVSSLGEGYLFTAEILEAATGRVAVRIDERARNEREVLDRVGVLSRKVRQHLGESLVAVRRAEPLPRVTTPSLDALELYAQAVRATQLADHDRAVFLLREAVARDSAFANAFYLGFITYVNSYQRDSARAYLERAVAHAERLTETTRYLVQGHWARLNSDLDGASQYFALALERDSTILGAATALANIEKMRGNDSSALPMYRRTLQMGPDNITPHFNLLDTALRLGDHRLADSVFALVEEHFPNEPVVLERYRLIRSSYFFEPDSAEAIANRMLRTMPRFWRWLAAHFLSGLAASRGRMEEARRWTLASLSEARALGLSDNYHRTGPPPSTSWPAGRRGRRTEPRRFGTPPARHFLWKRWNLRSRGWSSWATAR